MGMSASQARLLSLQARQSDLEYQGQQINQERSVLSQQVTGLYNNLLTMSVPTPPSTSDYTTVEYAGTVGATSYSFDASSVKPGNNTEKYGQTYIVTVFQNEHGHSLDKNPNVAFVNNAATNTVAVSDAVEQEQKVNDDGEKLYYTDENKTTESTDVSDYPVMTSKVYSETEIKDLYIEDNGQLIEASTNHFEASGDGYVLKSEYTGKLRKADSGSANVLTVASSANTVTVEGYRIYTLEQAEKLGKITDKQRFAYNEAIKNSSLKNTDGTALSEEDFYMYFNDEGETCFVRYNDIEDNNNNAITYTYIANGDISKATTYSDCKLEFDPTSGRITSLSIPVYEKDENGKTTAEISGWTTMEVAATTVTDEAAYEDAYNKYEYEKYQYDKTQQDINAKTETIQQMDRNLELKLQRLDNEREQITNEIDALDKVISENIESSYKTFSG